MIKYLLLFTCFGISTLTASAQVAKSQVYLFNLQQRTDSLFEFTQPRLLTAFNKQGYNNQPSFFTNDELYVTVLTPDQLRPDIYMLNLRTMSRGRVTQTDEGEYSPTPMPDQRFFSSVRTEGVDFKTQRLWQFPMDRSASGKPVFKYIENVGYHCWLDDYRAALFLVGEPNQLAIADIRTDQTINLVTRIGRCMQKLPNGNLAYVHKITDQTWYLKELNVGTNRSEIVIATLPGSEDFVILPDGTFLMGSGSKLYKYNPYTDRNWVAIADLKGYLITNITRMALSRDFKLALVNEIK